MKLKILPLGSILVALSLAACLSPGPTPTSTPSGPALTWHREGGLAGFCDDLIVEADGRVLARSCRGADQAGTLTEAQRSQLQVWLNALKAFDFTQTDIAQADALKIRVAFAGQGLTPASEADQIAIQAFAAEAFAGIYPLPEGPTPTPEVFNPLPEEARVATIAREILAQHLGVDITAVIIVEQAAQDWLDGCLGLGGPDEACAAVITPGYRFRLSVAGQEYEVRSNQDGSLVRLATPNDPAAACNVAGQSTYTDPGYCFAYPQTFSVQVNPDGMAAGVYVWGPPLDESAEPIRAMLSLHTQPAPAGKDLAGIVDDTLAQFTGLPAPELRQPITLGGEPAERLEWMPGREGSRDVFAVHAGTVYHLLFMPSLRDFPQAQADAEALFAAVVNSFTFLP
jgi:hypothetical protein